MHFGWEGEANRLILQIELSDEFPVISRVDHFPANEELYLCVRGVGLYPIEDGTPHRANGVVCVGPDIQVVHLATLVWETHNQRDVLPSESPRGKKATVSVQGWDVWCKVACKAQKRTNNADNLHIGPIRITTLQSDPGTTTEYSFNIIIIKTFLVYTVHFGLQSVHICIRPSKTM